MKMSGIRCTVACEQNVPSIDMRMHGVDMCWPFICVYTAGNYVWFWRMINLPSGLQRPQNAPLMPCHGLETEPHKPQNVPRLREEVTHTACWSIRFGRARPAFASHEGAMSWKARDVVEQLFCNSTRAVETTSVY